MCLDLIDGNTNNGGTVNLWECSEHDWLHASNPHQTWRAKHTTSVSFRFQLTINNVHHCLDAGSRLPGTRVKIWPCGDKFGAQIWTNRKTQQNGKGQ